MLGFIADSINPCIAILALLTPWLKGSTNHKTVWLYFVRTAFGLVIVYVIQYMDTQLSLWSALRLDYSTHTAFAVSLSTSVIVFNWRWSLFLVPLLVAYASIMIFLEYHSLGDIFTTALVIVPLTWLVHNIGEVHPNDTNANV
jgi:hypothetical protein